MLTYYNIKKSYLPSSNFLVEYLSVITLIPYLTVKIDPFINFI